MFIPTLTLALPSDKSDQQPCPEGDIYTDAEICCPKCSPGTRLITGNITLLLLLNQIQSLNSSLNFVNMWCSCFLGYRLVEECHAPGQRSNCTPCASGLFMDQMNYEYNCRSCRHCKCRVTFPLWFWQCCLRCWFALLTFSLTSTLLQHKDMRWRYQHVQDSRTLFVAVRTVIIKLLSTKTQMNVANVSSVGKMKRKNKNVSPKIWQCSQLLWCLVIIIIVSLNSLFVVHRYTRQ